MKQRSLLVRSLTLVLALAFLSAQTVAQSEPVMPDPGSAGMSRDDQIKLGQQAVGEVYKQMPVLPDSSPITQYVQQLGRKLERVIPQQNSWPYQFHVIQQKEINAFAVPGGPIFINIGTITAASNEAELAGVMSHEMSHVYMQHSAKAIHKQGMTQGAAQILGGVLGAVLGGTLGGLAQAGAQIGGGLLSMKYSRADEAQADAVGAIIMYKAGYNPVSLAQFFEKLEKEGSGPPQFLSDHPSPGNRVTAVEKEIKDWPSESYVSNSQGFVQAHQQAQGIKAYTAQEIDAGAKSGQWAQQNQHGGAAPAAAAAGGAVPATMGPVSARDVAPSKSWAAVPSNGVYTMRYPDNWQVMPNRQDQTITIAPQAGVAQNGIAYGVLTGVYSPQAGTSLADATQKMIQNLQQGNAGMQQTGGMSRIRVNRVDGQSVEFTGQSPIVQNGKALAEQDWLVTLQRPDGSLLFLVFIAPQKDFESFRPTYENMLRSLRLAK